MKYVGRGFTKCTCNQENNPYYVTTLTMRSPITPANITYQLYGCHDNQPPWKHHAVCWLHVTTSLYQFVSLCHFFLTLLVIGIDWHPSTPLGELLIVINNVLYMSEYSENIPSPLHHMAEFPCGPFNYLYVLKAW